MVPSRWYTYRAHASCKAYRVFQKRVTILITCHSDKYWPKRLCILWTGCSQHLSLINKNSSRTLQRFSQLRRDPHLTAKKKRRRRGLWCLKMTDYRAESMVFACLRPVLVYLRWSYERWKLRQWSRKGSHASKWGCTGMDHEIPCHIRHGIDKIVVFRPFSYQTKTSRISPLVRNPLLRRTSRIFVNSNA